MCGRSRSELHHHRRLSPTEANQVSKYRSSECGYVFRKTLAMFISIGNDQEFTFERELARKWISEIN